MFDYINHKDGNREDDLITSMSFFAHGTAFDSDKFKNTGHENDYAVSLGLYTYDRSNNNLNIFNSDIEKINLEAFDMNNYTYFGTCRTAAEFNGEVFAQNWVNVTMGKAHAATTRTSYKDIYPDDRNIVQKILNRLTGEFFTGKTEREKAREKYGFSKEGAINYPTVVEGGYLKWFQPD